MVQKYIGWRGTAGSLDISVQIREFISALTDESEGAGRYKSGDIVKKMVFWLLNPELTEYTVFNWTRIHILKRMNIANAGLEILTVRGNLSPSRRIQLISVWEWILGRESGKSILAPKRMNWLKFSSKGSIL